MKKSIFRSLIYVFLIISIVFFFGCSNNEIPLEQENINQDNLGNEEVDSGKVDNEEINNEEINDEEVVQEAKYYVDSNFLIKPLDSEDEKEVVLLTFDDAPKGDTTYKILDILDKYEAKAIFFVNGIYVNQYPELITEMKNRGHIIGTHTWTHINLNTITTEEETYKEIVSVNDLIEELTGERPVYFRPPNGAISKNPYAKQILHDDNMQTMNWSLGSRDWEIVTPEKYEEVVHEVLDNVYSGANILMHDKEITANALDAILSGLEEQGYKPVLPTEVIVENVSE